MARNAPKKSDQPANCSRAELAKALGVKLRRVDDYLAEGMPRTVELAKAWVVENVRQHGGNRGKRQPINPLSEEAMLDPSVSGTSPALERFRHARAGLAELELAAKQGSYLPRDKVHECFGRVANLLRSAGDRLQKLFGAEASGILNEALEEGRNSVAELCQIPDDGNAGGVRLPPDRGNGTATADAD